LKLILIAVIILGTAGSSLVTYGQRSNRRVNASRRKRAGAVKPQTETVAGAAKSSAVTTTPSGLIYIITRRSDGRQPRPGDTVAVNYTGLLGDGVKFDSSLDHGQPIKFKLGIGRVIKGWDEGIGKLRVREQATLIIPPQLGYGAKGAGGVIPPDATLIFIVELMSIEDAPASN
jgi:peptidylprolyl isomerase